MKIGEQSAFPGINPMWSIPGMTYRQWLIGMALQGCIASDTQRWHSNATGHAEDAIEMADAVIAAMEGEGQ